MKSNRKAIEGRSSAPCCASLGGKALYDADCKKRPTYHDGTPRKTWAQLGDVEQWSWNRPATTCELHADLGGLQPNLEFLGADEKWKPSGVINGSVTPRLVGRYRVLRHNDEPMRAGVDSD